MATLLNKKLLKSCVEKFHFPENEQRQKIEKIQRDTLTEILEGLK